MAAVVKEEEDMILDIGWREITNNIHTTNKQYRTTKERLTP